MNDNIYTPKDQAQRTRAEKEFQVAFHGLGSMRDIQRISNENLDVLYDFYVKGNENVRCSCRQI